MKDIIFFLQVENSWKQNHAPETKLKIEGSNNHQRFCLLKGYPTIARVATMSIVTTACASATFPALLKTLQRTLPSWIARDPA